ncbi:CBS domain-containing protein [Flagellimonas aquimarina]|jgi:CBS domain-containing membrane protein|uniref:CBS domain-containing protein n=1 Tax=Flagellimonas aquimarina TaxID=2201895 RepID=A0A316KWZ0_9FLAO|nr:CBS domain-containing protein [Allomuricauda koreensis]PWL38334.1 CBS domain-containing protein [Allomuricauda koreensis]
MKKRVPVLEIMSRDLITLTTNDDLVTAEELFKKHNIRHIPVISGNTIVGMLSYTDLLRISFADAVDEYEERVDTMVYNMFTISQVMARDVVSVPSHTTIKEVAQFLAKKEFHALPVVDDGKLVGIVTTTDLINYLLKLY